MAIDISGTCADKLAAVKDAFAANFVDNGDVGASVAVVKDGELVVDLWGGHLDRECKTPWQRDTIINVFSTTKTMSCLSLLVLAGRGLVDVDAPVAKYWPEFGQNGKGNVLVRHCCHTPPACRAGKSGSKRPIFTTGNTSPICSPNRRRGGSRARSPVTTASRRATSSAKSCVASMADRSVDSLPRKSRARSAPTSTSDSRRNTTAASRASFRRRRSRSTPAVRARP